MCTLEQAPTGKPKLTQLISSEAEVCIQVCLGCENTHLIFLISLKAPNTVLHNIGTE